MDETMYDAAWRAYKAAPRAVANGPSRSAVRAAVDAALSARLPVVLGQFRELAQKWADNAGLAPSPMTARSCSQQLLAMIDSLQGGLDAP